MSSLGDLLLGKIPEPEDVLEKNDDQPEGSVDGDNNRADSTSHMSNYLQSDISNDATNDRNGGNNQKIFPDRIEKKRAERVEDDCRSNASSTDDLVRELLDPNDRPRNVWHVVAEGEEQKSPVQQVGQAKPGDERETRNDYEDDNYSHRKRERRDDEPDGPNEDARGDADRRSDFERRSANGDRDENSGDQADGRLRDRRLDEEPRAPSSNRDGHDKKRSRDHDRDRERDPRRRSPDRHSKSRSKRGRHSGDEGADEGDEGRDYKRHRGGRSRRHERRSRSRSLSRDSGSRRRRHRSRSGSRSPVMKRNSRTILVMQLSPRVVTRDLEEFFEEIGRVKEVRLIMDSQNRRHKGIAYIEFESASSATKALSLNGQKFQGAPMQIQSALSERSRSSADRHAPSSSSHGAGGHHQRDHRDHHHHDQEPPRHHHYSTSSYTSSSHHSSSRSHHLPPNSYRVYMGGLNVGITEEMLRTIVEPFGFVHKVEVIKDRSTGLSRGYAFVTYASAEDGQEAIRNLDGFELAGKSMRVSKSTEKSEHIQTDRYGAK